MLLVVACALSFLLLAGLGARHAEQGARVLPVLDFAATLIATSGHASIAWGLEHGPVVGAVLTAALLLILLPALWSGRWRALPLLMVTASLAAATWGQALLWGDFLRAGSATLIVGVVLAFALGLVCTAPQWRPDAADPGQAIWPRREWLLVYGLVLLALLTRLWALGELPSSFIGEMGVSMLASRSGVGLRRYLPEALLGNSNGMWHLFPQYALYRLFGTSIYSLRLTAVFFGVTTVLLFYWMLRRLAGRPAAVMGTLLLIVGPEQLWWSRAENTYFEATMVIGPVSMLLGLWMLRRFSFAALCANALWMPLTRHFYLAGVAMLLFPWLVYVHGVLFVRRAWRTAWYALPVLAGGTWMWLNSLSVVHWVITGSWRFLNPAMHGESVGHRAGAESATWLELLWQQLQSLAANAFVVLRSLAYHDGGEQWYRRADAAFHSTSISAGVVVLAAVGVGYLLAQVYKPRAFALLLWLALGSLPAVLSTLPVPRRMTVAFPALYAIAALALDAFRRLFAERSGRVAGGLANAAAGLTLIGIAWTSLASHLSLPIAPPSFEPLFRFTKPLFEQSDAIYHNADGPLALLIGFANGDRLVDAPTPPCFQSVQPRDWLPVALRQPCDFRDAVDRLTRSADEVQNLQQNYRPPRRVTFLMAPRPAAAAELERIRALFPEAEEHRVDSPEESLRYVSLSVDRQGLDARRRPQVSFGAAVEAPALLADQLLAGTHLAPQPTVAGQSAALVRGALLIEQDDWYGFGIEPPCEGVAMTVDQRPLSSAALPLLSGVHAFELSIAAPQACTLPLKLTMQARGPVRLSAGPELLLLDPALAQHAALQSAPLSTYAGYGGAAEVPELRNRALDFGVDAAGNLLVLTQRDGSHFVIERFDRGGRELPKWEVTIAPGLGLAGMLVQADGGAVILAGGRGFRVNRSGHAAGEWLDVPIVTQHLARLPDGRILNAVPHWGGLVVLRPDGSQESVWRAFEGGRGEFEQPVSVAVGPAGRIAVVQADGTLLLFETPADRFAPRLVQQFRPDFTQELVGVVPISFDGRDRLLFGDQNADRTLVYASSGERLLANDPVRDPSSLIRGEARRIVDTPEQLYILDADLRLWRLPKS